MGATMVHGVRARGLRSGVQTVTEMFASGTASTRRARPPRDLYIMADMPGARRGSSKSEGSSRRSG
jgi:hypothetical protein